MIPLCNLHTHTSYCDGADTPAEMARAAYEGGAAAFGFSGHAPLFLDGEWQDWSMTREGEVQYFREATEQKELYFEKMTVLVGCELDIFSPKPSLPYDYTVGSVHYVCKNGRYIPMDGHAELLRKGVNELYGGDSIALAVDYFESVAQVVKLTDCDIVGHFDVLTKFCDVDRIFDESDKRYRDSALDAANELLKYERIFEINTGAMSRGYRKTPYPAPFILRHLAQKGARLTVTGDSHSTSALFFGYPEAEAHIRACGVKELCTVAADGSFVTVKI